MRKELKKKWIEALRSGKYQQGQDMLRNNNKFCCLGVLCDIYDPSKWSYDGCCWQGSSASLSFAVLADIEINPFEQDKLIKFNDGGRSFEWIAKYIEENM